MKNWIIALAILIIPMATYFVLDKTNQDTSGFEAQAAGKPAVIKFFSPMCLDCKKLEVSLKEVMPKYEGQVNYQKINGQANDANSNALVQKYSVVLVPTTVFVKKDGSVYKRTEGYLSPSQLENIIKGLING